MLTERARWYIESFLTEDLTLEQIAAGCTVSPFHLTRTFAMLQGMPMMRYVWRRRLTQAAERLAQGADSVLSVALDTGYASHEAFTRAFKGEFGLTPNQVRSGQTPRAETLTHPQSIERKTMARTLKSPRIEAMGERLLVGPTRRYDMQSRATIPAQWAAYNQEDVTPEGTIPNAWYGLCYGFSAEGGSFDYLCGVEVRSRITPPRGQVLVAVPPGKYARFASALHISTMNKVWDEIYGEWLGSEGLIARDAPSLEYYPLEFDGRTGEGGFEIWMPVE